MPARLASALLVPARWAQRSLIVLLALVPVVIVTAAFVPALVLLPFFPSAHRRAEVMVGQLTAWTRTLLVTSRGR
ncbi:hypothetical protein [Streptomyces virginiae]|uniref:hypothetical protein n=1 Tax=Streptomyces virginiae TaxID=1961 RepID=UPI002DBBEF21|nr:hypothetical protein [Streptomyces sp. CMAA1738]MEC4576211.1 hypothetical protein [Streptomyces sp. CMAA1738]